MNKEELEKYCAKNGPHAQLGDGVMVTNEYEFSEYYRYVGPPRATAAEALADRAFILAASKQYVEQFKEQIKAECTNEYYRGFSDGIAAIKKLADEYKAEVRL